MFPPLINGAPNFMSSNSEIVGIDRSLKFAVGSTDAVRFPNTGTDPVVGSLYMWAKLVITNNTARLFDKSNGGPGFWRLQYGGGANNNTFRLLVDFTTQDVDAIGAANILVDNVWYFLAATYDGTTPRLYYGDRLTPAREPASYILQVGQSGTRVTDAGAVEALCNQSAAGSTAAPNATVAVVNWIPGVTLTLAELRDHQFYPRPHPGTRVLAYPGQNGNLAVFDWSGRGNMGTVTGTVVAADALLGIRTYFRGQ